MEKMKQFLPQADMEKLKRVLQIKENYLSGKTTLAEARQLLKEKVGTLKPYEIALAEQALKEMQEDECRKENIQQMLELFDGIMDVSRPELEPQHPILCYYRENDALRKILLSIEDLVQYPPIKNQWLEVYDLLAQYRIHLSRKQNQLYSVLEKKGFDRPTTTMWLLDDFVRDEIKDARRLLEADREEEFIACQQTIVNDIRDLMGKEETVLYPTALAMITPQEFEEMKAGDREIGFAWIETAEASPVVSPSAQPHPQGDLSQGLATELAALLGKYGYGTDHRERLNVTTGQLTLEQINLIYKHLPVDISYVDENELVCFYSDTDHRVFPRSKNVIGRDVKNCHPRTSVHVVKDIIEKFRSGEQDRAEFWINKPGFFVYIYYVAVRDQEGKFRGVLEMMQDCTRIRNLEGSRTLLTWDNEVREQAPAKAPSAEEASPANAPAATCTPNITPSTLLKDLLDTYPGLKEKMTAISPKFQLLRTPLARVMLPKATISTISERTGIPVEELIAALKAQIASL